MRYMKRSADTTQMLRFVIVKLMLAYSKRITGVTSNYILSAYML